MYGWKLLLLKANASLLIFYIQALLFVFGAMNLVAAAALAVLVLAEKALPWGAWIARGTGALLVIWGVWIMISASG